MQQVRGFVSNTGGQLIRPTTHDHSVLFYESDSYLCEEVTRYLALGLRAGQPLIVIATEPHREAFKQRLVVQGFDVGAAIRSGQFTLLDARETLSRFMVEGIPDADRVHDTLGGVIENSRGGNPYVSIRAFGEMVDILWRDGLPDAAIRLEELWNDLADVYSFSLFCGYAMGNFSREGDTSRFHQMCGQHARVIPTERYGWALDEDARLREISFLQHRAHAVETEIQQRKKAEAALRQALTEQKMLLDRERIAREEAESAGRMKDEFLAILSHELRTPLTAIVGWARILESAPEEMRSRGLEVIRRNADLQLNLINDLLDVSRIISGKMMIDPQPLDLSPVVAAAMDIVRPAAATKSVKMEFRMDEAAQYIRGDAHRLQQVVWNLLSNAVKFTPAHGTVFVHLKKDASQVQLEVRDNGKGIKPEFLPHVFERFRQENASMSREHGGLGLGLAIVRYLVEAHGGSISAQSAGEGKGASFVVRLPL